MQILPGYPHGWIHGWYVSAGDCGTCACVLSRACDRKKDGFHGLNESAKGVVMTGIPQNEFKTILNGIRDFILIISPDQKILEVNDVFLKRMGYRRHEVIGRPCYEVFQRVTRKSSNCHENCPLDQVIRKRRHCQVELSRVDQKGKTWYTELTIFPIWKKKGKIHKFIEISRDITQRKADEKKNREHLQKMVEDRTRQLKESHEKLLHQDKMASLGKLSSSVVHEINNPVAGILNLVLLCKGRGVGLGLSVVYGIIEEHGGKLYVDSTEGQGTCFTITLQTAGPP